MFSLTLRYLLFGLTIGGLFAGGFSGIAQAQNAAWINTTNTAAEWNVSGNWSGGTVPAVNQGTVFNQNATYQVHWNAATGNTQAGFHYVADADDITFLNTDGGDYTHTTSDVFVEFGTLNLDGINLAVDNEVFVGFDGSLSIGNGSQVTSSSGFSGNDEGYDASFVVTGPGSKWTVVNQLLFDNDFPDSAINLTIAAGGQVETHDFNFIDIGGGGSILTVTGANSHLQVNGSLLANGQVAISVTDGATTTVVGSTTIGVLSSVVSGNGSRFETGDLFLSQGALNIDNNATVSVVGTTSFRNFFGTLQGDVNLSSGRFEFGSTSLESYEHFNATGGTLAGQVRLTDFNSTAEVGIISSQLDVAGVDTSEVLIGNSGVISGSGVVNRGLHNNADGQLRSLSGQSIQFAGAGSVNAGQINAFGGSVEFAQNLTNQAGGEINNIAGTIIAGEIHNQAGGQINGRGVFQANGGISNEGRMSFSATITELFGHVANLADGQIISTGGGTINFHDDVIHNGTEIRTSAGSQTVFMASLTGAGNFTGLGDVLIEADFQPGNSPAEVSFAGNLTLGDAAITEIELAGLNDGQFDRLLIDGDFDIAGSLNVVLINGFTLGLNQRFLIADVGGIIDGQFFDLAEGASVGIFGDQELFITYQGFGSSNGVGLFTAVPEPSSFAILSIAALLLIRRRKF